jgi:ABC-type Fe3+ transport system substrate-binding protein
MKLNFKSAIAILFTSTILTAMPAISQADWIEDWKGNLNEMWTSTKEATKKGWEAVVPKTPIEIGIAYGTEKKKWFEWAVAEFAKTEAGKKIKVNLIPMGSVEGAEAVLQQDKRIHVWSPASGVVQALLTEQWEKDHGNDPIYSDAPLALTPMVIVMWEDRYDAFIAKYQEINFKTLAEALAEKTGWAAIANKPDWGYFTFGHTMPTHSNSGLLTLVLMAYDYADVSRRLKAKHIMEEGFLTWLEAAVENISAEQTSTGKLMKEMLRYGPSKLNAIMVYENLALSNLENARGRWGKLKMVYPSRSVWNDNPYYILDVPWTTDEHKNAAKLFQDFLLSEKAQKVARDEYLFRPANVDVPIIGEGSAFDKLQNVVKINVPTIQRPSAEVLKQLIQIWERNAE